MTHATANSLDKRIRENWRSRPNEKVRRYVGRFFARTRTDDRIAAKVQGNHGVYTVSIQMDATQILSSACSCYIGKHGGCHHCHALALTFLDERASFEKLEVRGVVDIRDLDGLREFLQGVTLADLLKRLKARGVTQKSVAESIGMNPRHLTALKSSELRNRFYNELGATKLACMWILENLGEG